MNIAKTILSAINELYLIYFISLFWKYYGFMIGLFAGLTIFIIDLIILSNDKNITQKVLVGKIDDCDFSTIVETQVMYKTMLMLILAHVFNLTFF